MSKTSRKSLFDNRKSTYCILLKVIPDKAINTIEEYHNQLIYYPINSITGKDSQEVSILLLN